MLSAAGDATADAVVVGGGTVGAWCAYFLRRSGLDQVILLEKRTLGQGASSRAAGDRPHPGRHQLGGPARRVVPPVLPGPARASSASTPASPRRATCCRASPRTTSPPRGTRMAMQNALGLSVRWLEPDEVDRLNPTLAPGLTRGGTFCAEDGYLTPPRNVTAYAVALAVSGVAVREHTAFTGLVTRRRPGHRRGDQPGPDRQPARGAHRRARAGRGRPAWPGSTSRPAACGTRWRSPSRTRTWTRPGCRWSSTCPRACTGAPRRRACCSA